MNILLNTTALFNSHSFLCEGCTYVFKVSSSNDNKIKINGNTNQILVSDDIIFENIRTEFAESIFHTYILLSLTLFILSFPSVDISLTSLVTSLVILGESEEKDE